MAYTKQTFIDKVTVLKAEHLNHIEQGIVDIETALDNAAVEFGAALEQIVAEIPSEEDIVSAVLAEFTDASEVAM